MSIALRYAARSDVGLVRANNQDSGFAGPHLLVVADGMGGHAGGDVASSVAIAAMAPLDDEAHGPDDALAELDRALHDAQDQLLLRAEQDPDLAGLGTTVTAILRAGNKLAMAHIGDSRGYLLRDGVLSQVTTDHTFVQHLVNTGRITQEEAEHHPQRSVVMRVLGDHDMEIVPDLSVREARAGDRWLLCSDGLSGVVSFSTLEETLRDVPDVAQCADQLVQLALRGGGTDNITVIVADVVELDELPDGAGPSTISAVVGSAARNRHDPTSAVDGPAARAADLARKAKEAEAAAADGDVDPDAPAPAPVARRTDDVDVDEVPRSRRTWLIALAVVVVLVVGGVWLGYRWTQTQYYVGVSDGQLAVFQGIPQNVGPIELSSVVEVSETAADDLEDWQRVRVEQTIPAESLSDARARVEHLESEADAASAASG